MSAKTEHEQLLEIHQKLTAEGITSHIESSRIDGESVEIISIPAWEDAKGTLSRKAVYEFIHSKLAGAHGKGFLAQLPGHKYIDVYAYNPITCQSGAAVDSSDLLVCSTSTKMDQFAWDEMIEGDDSAWDDGWDVHGTMRGMSNRVALLSLILNHQIVDLPPVAPLTVKELVATLKQRAEGASLFCHGPDYNKHWSLRLSDDDTLVLHKSADNSLTPIGAEHFDANGAMIVDGRVLMHRCWGF